MTWRSIESERPKPLQRVWLADNGIISPAPIQWKDLYLGSWTHWSPCEPPKDLPPKPKTAFEEWVSNQETGLDGALIWVTTGKGRSASVNADVCEVIFKAGAESGKASK